MIVSLGQRYIGSNRAQYLITSWKVRTGTAPGLNTSTSVDVVGEDVHRGQLAEVAFSGDAADLTGTLADARIPSTIARDTEIPSAADAAPSTITSAAQTGAQGTSTDYAREDHVHGHTALGGGAGGTTWSTASVSSGQGFSNTVQQSTTVSLPAPASGIDVYHVIVKCDTTNRQSHSYNVGAQASFSSNGEDYRIWTEYRPYQHWSVVCTIQLVRRPLVLWHRCGYGRNDHDIDCPSARSSVYRNGLLRQGIEVTECE